MVGIRQAVIAVSHKDNLRGRIRKAKQAVDLAVFLFCPLKGVGKGRRSAALRVVQTVHHLGHDLRIISDGDALRTAQHKIGAFLHQGIPEIRILHGGAGSQIKDAVREGTILIIGLEKSRCDAVMPIGANDQPLAQQVFRIIAGAGQIRLFTKKNYGAVGRKIAAVGLPEYAGAGLKVFGRGYGDIAVCCDPVIAPSIQIFVFAHLLRIVRNGEKVTRACSDAVCKILLVRLKRHDAAFSAAGKHPL